MSYPPTAEYRRSWKYLKVEIFNQWSKESSADHNVVDMLVARACCGHACGGLSLSHTRQGITNTEQISHPHRHMHTQTHTHTVQENYFTKTKRTTTKLQNWKFRKRERGKPVWNMPFYSYTLTHRYTHPHSHTHRQILIPTHNHSYTHIDTDSPRHTPPSYIDVGWQKSYSDQGPDWLWMRLLLLL